MLRIGLTGGIAAGKSAVATELGRLGAVVVDADLLARAVVDPGTPGFDEVVRTFGTDVLGRDGALDRPALGRLVFGDSGARETLNRIIHPRVRAEAARLIDGSPADAVVVEDIPLLVETHQAARFHLVLVVDAPDETRIARMIERRGMDREDAEQRIAAQAPRGERRAAADAVLVNDGTPEALVAATQALWDIRILPFAVNLVHGRPARTRPPAAPDPHGADLPAGLAGTHGLARRMAAKLTAALPAGAAVEPGPGSDVVVAEVLVRPGPGEDLAAVSAAVAAAGFPRAEVPRGSDAGVHRSGTDTVIHRSADPALDVTVTVLPVGAGVLPDGS